MSNIITDERYTHDFKQLEKYYKEHNVTKIYMDFYKTQCFM